MREIGSEFNKVPVDSGYGLIYPRPGTLVFSGRTAIEAILRHLPEAHTALLPSYCCDSMIVPFRAAGIDVSFYKVQWDGELKIEIDRNADILLWCNYFGFRSEMPDFHGVIIEDITHSFFSDSPCHPRSDYLVASIRKWEPVNCGGYCSVDVDYPVPANEFVTLKTAAMELKTAYLETPRQKKKEKLLSMLEQSNHWLAKNYSGLSIDPWSREFLSHVDVKKQRSVRRKNAEALYEGLSGKVEFMFPEQDMGCPLFVPLLLKNRDEVRAHLTKNKIYCPIHWPKPEGCKSNIYNLELSLICDQRYEIKDMKRIVSVMQEVL